jgi:putative addiction module component (TIGR02574 family)
MAPEFQHLEKLPLAERIQLVEDLWDSIAQTQGEDLPVPEWQKAELSRRKEQYARDPECTKSWSEVKRSILASKRDGGHCPPYR